MSSEMQSKVKLRETQANKKSHTEKPMHIILSRLTCILCSNLSLVNSRVFRIKHLLTFVPLGFFASSASASKTVV